MNIRILYHDHCFDGAASAAYFSRFIADAVPSGCGVSLYGHGAQGCSQLSIHALFDGDENAIVDFKYCQRPKTDLVVRPSSERLSSTPRIRSISAAIPAAGSSTIPSYKSCTAFICRVADDRFGFRAPTWTTWCTGR